MATIDLGKIKQGWRGTYNNSTAYAVDDLVEYTDGAITSSYICTTASTGNAPSSGGTAHGSWAYVAKGAAGTPTTTRGDIIRRGASADERLPKGSNGQYLQMGADDPAWVTLSTSPTTTQGDVIYRGASADARLAKGTAGQVLTMNSGATAPEWAAAAAGGKILKIYNGTFSTLSPGQGSGNWTDVKTISVTPTSSSSHFIHFFQSRELNIPATSELQFAFMVDGTGGDILENKNYSSSQVRHPETLIQYWATSKSAGTAIDFKIRANYTGSQATVGAGWYFIMEVDPS